MLRYSGVEFNRLYLTHKDRRLAWKAYVEEQYWICDFGDCRKVYNKLFKNWDDESYWTELAAFLDTAY